MATITTRDIFDSLTTEQKQSLKSREHEFRAATCVRGKAKSEALEALGYKMDKFSAQMYIMDYDQYRELVDMAYEHGPAVAVLRIAEKYSDNNGAWEVATLVDAEGREFELGNMYDSSACFRTMSHEQLIAYANRDTAEAVEIEALTQRAEVAEAVAVAQTGVIAKVWIYEQFDTLSHKVWFEGECDLIAIKTNIPELAGELVTFSSESRRGVLTQVIESLQARGLSGVIRIQG